MWNRFGLKTSVCRWIQMTAIKNSFVASRVDWTNIQNLQYAPVAGLTRSRRRKWRSSGRLSVNWIKLTMSKTKRARFWSLRRWMGLEMKNAKMQRKRIIAGICKEITRKNLVWWIRYALFERASILLMLISESEIRIFKLHEEFLCQEWSLVLMRSFPLFLSFRFYYPFSYSFFSSVYWFVFSVVEAWLWMCIRVISTVNQNLNGTLLVHHFLPSEINSL